MAYIEANGLRFHYQWIPSKNPKSKHVAIYLHGLIMDNLSSGYFTLVEPLTSTHHCLLYDLRGHGKSQSPPQGYALSDHVRDLYTLLKTLNLLHSYTFDFLGCSFGGMLTLAFMIQYPTLFRKGVLIDGHIHTQSFLDQLVRDLQSQGDQQTHLIGTHFQHWLNRDRTRKRNKLIQRAQFLIHKTTLIEDLKNHTPALDLLSFKPTHPLLGLYGEGSDALSTARLLFEHQTQKGESHSSSTSNLVCFPNATHALLWEQTQAVQEQIKAWLNDSD